MTPLKGDAALQFHQQLKQRNAKERADRLRAAKALAAGTKEAFDLRRLEKLCDTTERGRLDDEAERQAVHEYAYYVEHPRARTLEDFARILSEIGDWS